MPGELLDNRGRGETAWSVPSIHPEGRKFGLIAVGIALFFLAIDWDLLGWPMLGLAVWVFAFFRDPERIVPQDDRLILSPADGQVTLIAEVPPPAELCGPGTSDEAGLGDKPVWRVSIFLSLFDVHVIRTPIGGTVRRLAYIPGRFLNADLDKASEENERQHLLIERRDGARIGFSMIAGLLARRIVPFAKRGDMIAAGARVGLIRFGSRVDLYLPSGTAPAVLLGQRVVAGETVLAVMGEAPEIEGIVQ